MFELIPRIGLECVLAYQSQLSDPFTAAHPWYVLIEWEFGTDGQPDTFAQNVLGQAAEQDLINDAVIATSEVQAQKLLALRENMSAAQKSLGKSIKHDITIPIAHVAEFIERASPAIDKIVPGIRPIPFGHFGDGNIHYNTCRPEHMMDEAFSAFEPAINDCVYTLVTELGGSISAEHGIGIQKREAFTPPVRPR